MPKVLLRKALLSLTWFKVKSKSNFDLLNNFDDYLDKLKQSETFSNVKNYFSDREIWSAIRK